MQAKAISDLAQLSDDDLFVQVVEGLRLIHENALEIRKSARDLLSRDFRRGAAILKLVAEEEAAKFLILLDAVRCPRSSNQDKPLFKRQLQYFYDHLCRGIYVEYYRQSIWYDFNDVRGFVEHERAECYLDGPDFLCWIMPNRIRSNRENIIYVDYLRSQEGSFWSSPATDVEIVLNLPESSLDDNLFNIVDSLSALIAESPEALKVIASIWRQYRMDSVMSVSALQRVNAATVEAIQHLGTNNRVTEERLSVVHELWHFPLYDLDLSLKTVSKQEMKQILEAENDAFWSSVI